MGCPCSKVLANAALSNPLQQLQAAEAPTRAQRQRRRQEEKRQRQLGKLQKRNARKRRQQRAGSSNAESGHTGGGIICRNSLRRSMRGSGSHSAQPQLRLLGGSNGSSATECASALYARTLEQQREEHQRTIEQRTRQQLERNLHTFLLNQLLLGMQFFGHYEHELAAIDEELLAKQRASTQQLSEHSLLLASAIDAAIAKRLLYKSSEGPKQLGQSSNTQRAQLEPLQKPLTYVVFDNVDVARPNDANYDSIAALCKVLLETDYYNITPCRSEYVQLLEQTRWMGYVRLKLREATPMQQQRSLSCSPSSIEGDMGDIEGVYTDGSSGYSTGTGTINNSGSDRGSWDRGDYDHVYISRLNTQRSMEELKLTSVALQPNVLPEACICRLASCLPSWLEQSDDEMDDNESSDEEAEHADQLQQDSSRSGYETVQVLRQCSLEQLRRRAQLQQCYLSSQQFMHYFGELLRHQLGQELGISQKELASASYRGCSIYTATDELVPAIHVPHSWPDCAFEFNLRVRPQTGDHLQWPTAQMRKRLQSFGYHVVPMGYAPKRARNPFRELEWRIVFPQAEQFLERQLARTQLKILLVMKTLVRSFVNEKCQAMGHIMEQLRAHLFWQCERQSNDWPEEFLGEHLVRFVRSFADCLAKKHLSDYFIERRNLFEHVPEDALMELRSIMAGIAEQPLVHVLQALRSLQHAEDFYPKLNYDRLLETLVTQDYLQLRSWAKFSRNPLPVLEQQPEQPQQEANDAQGLLGMRQHQERTRGKLRRKTQMLRAQQLQFAEQRRESVDATVLDMPLLIPRGSQASQMSQESRYGPSTDPAPFSLMPQLNDGVEILRRTNLLELLLDHLLAMLPKAIEFRSLQHAQLYLEQAQRLCRLYQQLGCAQNATHYADALCQAAINIERANSGPSTSCATNSMCRKAIKFVEQVQLHSGERPSPSPPSTARVPQPSASKMLTDVEQTVDAAPGNEPQPTAAVDILREPMTKLDTLLQQLQLESKTMKTISSKTDQLMQTLAPELGRDELRDMLKRNTQKLKEAFN